MEQLKQWIADINSDPNPEHIRENKDKSKYIPISFTQNLLDEIFLGQWDFEVLRESYGKKWARGYGKMTATHPVTGKTITRGGDAAIVLTGDLKMDSPRLEAMIQLSCARKFGRVFGRDLNRDLMDAPLPVTPKDAIEPVDVVKSRLIALMEQCTTVKSLSTWLEEAEKVGAKQEFETMLRLLTEKEQ